MDSNKHSSAGAGGIGLGTVIFVVFLILKLTGLINWSWWWVTAPIWIPVGIVLILLTTLII